MLTTAGSSAAPTWQATQNTLTDLSRNTVISVSGPTISGGLNTILGYQTVCGPVVGSNNVYIGAQLMSSATGSYNVVIGNLAPSGLLNGSYNTIIGWSI